MRKDPIRPLRQRLCGFRGCAGLPAQGPIWVPGPGTAAGVSSSAPVRFGGSARIWLIGKNLMGVIGVWLIGDYDDANAYGADVSWCGQNASLTPRGGPRWS